MDSSDGVGSDRDIVPGQQAKHGDYGMNACLAVRGQGRVPQPRDRAPKAPSLISAARREKINAAGRRAKIWRCTTDQVPIRTRS
jgi:hypothetical protein